MINLKKPLSVPIKNRTWTALKAAQKSMFDPWEGSCRLNQVLKSIKDDSPLFDFRRGFVCEKN